MFCTSCGQQIPDGSKFCTKCGQPVAVETAVDAAPETGTPQMTPPTPGAIPAAAAAAPKAPKKVDNKIIGIAAVAVAAIIAIVLVLVLRKPTINLDKYFAFEYNGYNTVGTVSVEFDKEQFNKDYGDKVTAKSLEKAVSKYKVADTSLSDLVDFIGGYDALASYINEDLANSVLSDLSWSVDPTEGLSNGDTVTLTWDNDESDVAIWEAVFGCKIKAEDMTVKVEGLEDIETFDAFDGVEITYKGTAPNGSVDEITRGSEAACKDLYYNVEPSNGLSNGDTVTVTISYNGYREDWQNALAEDYGMVPAELTKEYTVEGLAAYVTDYDDIPEDVLENMKSQAEDTFYAEVAGDSYSSDTEKLVDVEYIGNYFLVSKDLNSSNDKNVIYLIYKAADHLSFTNDDGDSYENTVEYYWYCRFDSLMTTDDGNCTVNLMQYDTSYTNRVYFSLDSKVSNGWWGSTHAWKIYGYDKLNLMYNQLVTTRLDKYTVVDNVEDITLTGDGTDVQSEDDPIEDDTKGSGDGEVDGDDGQVLSYSSDRKLTEDDLKNLTKDEIQTAINEIYARHGYTFKDETILAQFKQYDWYKPTVASGDFSESVFSQIEKDNVALMREHL